MWPSAFVNTSVCRQITAYTWFEITGCPSLRVCRCLRFIISAICSVRIPRLTIVFLLLARHSLNQFSFTLASFVGFGLQGSIVWLLQSSYIQSYMFLLKLRKLQGKKWTLPICRGFDKTEGSTTPAVIIIFISSILYVLRPADFGEHWLHSLQNAKFALIFHGGNADERCLRRLNLKVNKGVRQGRLKAKVLFNLMTKVGNHKARTGCPLVV